MKPSHLVRCRDICKAIQCLWRGREILRVFPLHTCTYLPDLRVKSKISPSTCDKMYAAKPRTRRIKYAFCYKLRDIMMVSTVPLFSFVEFPAMPLILY